MKEVEAGEMSLDRQIYLLIGGVQGRKIGNQAMENIFVNQAEASGLKMGETQRGDNERTRIRGVFEKDGAGESQG